MRKRRLVWLIMSALLHLPSLLHAQGPVIKARIDSPKVQIGDAITLTLSADYDPQLFQVQFPVINDTFNHFELIEKGNLDTISGKEQHVISQKIQLINFDSGVWYIPAFAFNIKPLQGQTSYTLFTDSLQVNVNTIPVDTTKPFKPIFGIREAAMPLEQVIMYIAGGLLLLGVAVFLIYYFIKKYRNKNKSKAPVIKDIILQPHEKALQAIEKLEAAQLWQQGFEKDYYTALTDIIRSYLEEQFNMDCFEKTSSEIMYQVKRNRALANLRKELRQLFETADMVKFAKSKPGAEQHIESLDTGKHIILESFKKIKPAEVQ